EDTYRDNGNRPVHLVGHSNGPLYAQYLLTHTSRAWRDRYIHGFTPIAGNFPGQGLLYSMLFTGLNVQDFGYPTTPAQAATSARHELAHVPDAPVDLHGRLGPEGVRRPGGHNRELDPGSGLPPAGLPGVVRRRAPAVRQADRRLLPRFRQVHRAALLPRCRRVGREGIGSGHDRRGPAVDAHTRAGA